MALTQPAHDHDAFLATLVGLKPWERRDALVAEADRWVRQSKLNDGSFNKMHQDTLTRWSEDKHKRHEVLVPAPDPASALGMVGRCLNSRQQWLNAADGVAQALAHRGRFAMPMLSKQQR